MQLISLFDRYIYYERIIEKYFRVYINKAELMVHQSKQRGIIIKALLLNVCCFRKAPDDL